MQRKEEALGVIRLVAWGLVVMILFSDADSRRWCMEHDDDTWLKIE